MENKYDVLKLENQLCFPLYAAAKEIVNSYRPFLNEIGLTYTQYITMMVLWEHKECSIKEIGERLMLDSGTLTPVLKSLENKGYVIRSRCQHDERIVTVKLTDKGEKLKETAVEIPSKVARCISLSADEAKTLYELLYKILDR